MTLRGSVGSLDRGVVRPGDARVVFGFHAGPQTGRRHSAFTQLLYLPDHLVASRRQLPYLISCRRISASGESKP
jgi:hypothetical protein